MYGMYTIKDSAANEYGPLITAKNDAVAIRQFKNLMKNTDFPEDFSIFKIGEFNEETGVIEDFLTMTCIYTGENYMEDTKYEITE